MTNWVIRDARLGAQPILNAESTQSTAHELGDCVKADDRDSEGASATFMYVQASGAVSANQWVAIDENFQAVAGTSALGTAMHRFGVCPAALANDEYGWAAVSGTGVSATFDGTASADLVVLYTSSTAGSLSDITSGAKLSGVTLVTAVSTTGQTAEVLMTYPHFIAASN